jgi:hypothetical protein
MYQFTTNSFILIYTKHQHFPNISDFSNTKVRLEREGNKEVTIVGLNEFGYLKVVDRNYLP